MLWRWRDLHVSAQHLYKFDMEHKPDHAISELQGMQEKKINL